MEVVINRCFGGFGLSDAAVEMCIELGMTLTEYIQSGPNKGSRKNPSADFTKSAPLLPSMDTSSFGKYHIADSGKDFRCNPIVIKVVKKLKKKSWGRFAELEIVDIPFDDTSGWDIHEYDGSESIEESHRSW